MRITVEEGLREIEDRATMLRYLLDSASLNPAAPEPKVLSGLADLMKEIADTVQKTRKGLDVAALSTELKR